MGRICRIMGILNVTPDSFYDGGRYCSVEDAFSRASQMVTDGADYIDVGGESTRPGAKPVSVDEELSRVIPVIERITSELDVAVSVDTTKHEVAAAAVSAGVSMINDISGLTFDEKMAETVSAAGVYLVIMHTSGRPENMQQIYSYSDVNREVREFLVGQAGFAEEKGVSKDRIILDPGIGFGKSLEQNYSLLKGISELKNCGYPVLIGLSRKSLIGKLYENGEDRLPATIALNSFSVMCGAEIIRVHDVREHVLALKAVGKLMEAVS